MKLKNKQQEGKSNKMVTITSLVLGVVMGAGTWIYNTPTLDSGDIKIDPAITQVMSTSGRGTGFFVEHNGLKLLVDRKSVV